MLFVSKKAVFAPETLEAVVSDVDLTLYPVDAGYLNACTRAVESLPVDLRSFFKIRQLKQIARTEGLHKGRALPKGLVSLANQARRLMEHDFVAPNGPLVAAFQALSSPDQVRPMQLFVMSHSDKKQAQGVLARLGVTPETLPSSQIVTPDHYHGFSKSRANDYLLLFNLVPTLKPHQMVLIDDSLSNLQAAHQAGLQTVWIQAAGISALEKPDYVGFVAQEAVQALARIHEGRHRRAETKTVLRA